MSVLKRFRKSEDGLASIEFVVAIPLLLSMLIFAWELGLALVRQSLLEQAVDVTVREVRLGHVVADDFEKMRDYMCHVTRIIPNCPERLKLELRVVHPYDDDLTTMYLPPEPDCAKLVVEDPDGAIDQAAKVQRGQSRERDVAGINQIVMMRACIVVDPFFRGGHVDKALSNNNGNTDGLSYRLTARSLYVVEP